MILVGTKCDEEGNRKVKTEVAQKYVDELFKECSFIETSAKTNHNVQEAFQVINLSSPALRPRSQYRRRDLASRHACCCPACSRLPLMRRSLTLR